MSDTKTKFDDRKLEELNKALVEGEFVTPDTIYFDASLFWNLTAGTIGAYCRTLPLEEGRVLYGVLMKNLSRMDTAQFRDDFDSFEGFAPYKDAVLAFRDNPENSDTIFQHSPVTGFVYLIDNHLAVNVNNSQASEKYTKIPVGRGFYQKKYDTIRFLINTYPFSPTEKFKGQAADFFMQNFRVDVAFINIRSDKLRLKFFTKLDEIYTDKLDMILENAMINNAFSDMKLLTKQIFARPIFSLEKKKEVPNKEMFDRDTKLVGARLNMLSKFTWLVPKNYATFTQSTKTVTLPKDELDDSP